MNDEKRMETETRLAEELRRLTAEMDSTRGADLYAAIVAVSMQLAHRFGPASVAGDLRELAEVYDKLVRRVAN